MSLSNQTTPSFADQNEVAINALFSSVRVFLVMLGTILAGHGMTETGLYFWIEAAAGSIMILGPAVWGVYNAVQNFLNTRKKVMQGMNAGIALGVSGNALMTTTSTGASVPVPVTPATTKEIIKIFAPPETP